MKENLVYFLMLMLSINDVIAVDYCQANTFIESKISHFMQFTKESVDQEFAVDGQFKALHCCAKGYRSIEW